jgi:tetratricopeptide (TPR) repeat protein
MSAKGAPRVEEALQSMQEQAAAKSWRGVFKLTEAVKPEEKTAAFFAVRRYRVLALVKLRLFKNAGDDLTGLDLSHPAVPFELRLLNALVPSLNSNHAQALDLLYGLLDWLQARPEEERGREKARQTRLAQVSVLARQRDLLCAIELVESMLGEGREAALLSLLGQLCLELGDIARAAAAFAEAAPLLTAEEAPVAFKLLAAMNAGLLHFARSEYDRAMVCFDEVAERGPDSPYAVAAVNNKAVCLLFTRNLAGALALLEERLAARPGQFLEEVFVCNLCTLLDLHSEKPGDKKGEIAKLAAAHGETFDINLIT